MLQCRFSQSPRCRCPHLEPGDGILALHIMRPSAWVAGALSRVARYRREPVRGWRVLCFPSLAIGADPARGWVSKP